MRTNGCVGSDNSTKSRQRKLRVLRIMSAVKRSLLSTFCCSHLSQIRICNQYRSDSSPETTKENATYPYTCSSIGVRDGISQYRGAPLESRLESRESDTPAPLATYQRHGHNVNTFFGLLLQPKQDSLRHQDTSLHITYITLSETLKVVSCIQ